MAQLLKQKQVYDIIKCYDDKLDKPAANGTTTEKATLKHWMQHHGVGRSIILLGMEPTLQAEYTVVDYVTIHSVKLSSAYNSKLNLNIFESSDHSWEIMPQDCGNVDNYILQMDWKRREYTLCAGP